MKCFKDFIGLEYNCTNIVSDSGLYINQFAGVSVKSIDNLANSEQKHFLKVWDDVQEISILNFETLLKMELSKQVSILENFENYNTSIYDNFTNNTQSNNLVGIRFFGTKEKYTSLNLSTLNIYTLTNVNDAKIYIYCLNSGRKLKEITQDLTIGFNQLNLNYTYSENLFKNIDLFICYNAQQITTIQSNLENDVCQDSNYYSLNIGGGKINNTLPFVKANFINENQTFGLDISFNFSCEFDNLICNMRGKFTQAWGNTLYINLLKQRKYSERINFFTVEFSNEEIDNMITNLENETKTMIQNIVENISIPCSNCFERDRQIQSKFIFP